VASYDFFETVVYFVPRLTIAHFEGVRTTFIYGFVANNKFWTHFLPRPQSMRRKTDKKNQHRDAAVLFCIQHPQHKNAAQHVGAMSTKSTPVQQLRHAAITLLLAEVYGRTHTASYGHCIAR
jgi:hypothetical protein